MYGKVIYAFVVVLIIGLGVSFFVLQDASRTGKTYTNSVYKYELSYPSKFDIKEYADDIAAIGTVTKDAVDAVADVRVITAQGEAGQTMQDAVADQLKNLCAADGPNESLSCTKTLSTEPFTTDHADTGFVLILSGELKDTKSGTVKDVPQGPYYVLPLATSATISRVLVIAPPMNRSAREADKTLIQAIAQSVYLTK